MKAVKLDGPLDISKMRLLGAYNHPRQFKIYKIYFDKIKDNYFLQSISIAEADKFWYISEDNAKDTLFKWKKENAG